MPTVSVKIDSQSKYTIELNPEYSAQEFIDTAQKHIKFVNGIVSGQERLNQPAIPAAEIKPDIDSRPPGKQTAGKGPEPQLKTVPSPKQKIITAKLLLIMAVILAFACGIGAIYLRHSDLVILTSEKATPPPVFKAKISPVPEPAKTDISQGAVPTNPGAAAAKKKAPPLPELNKIIIEARELTWMRIGEDRNPAYEIMLRPGDRLEREASRFRLKIGNAKGVDITFNKKNISLASGRGNVVFVKLPR